MYVPAYTFAEFSSLARKFGEGHFDLFIVVGSPGLSKSRTLAEVCPDARLIQGGSLSAFGLYCQLYQFKDQTLVVDDIDSLYTNKDAVRLLKATCQTEKVKKIGWYTMSAKLPKDDAGVPVGEFETKSRVCIIANEWKSFNKNVAAVGDRGVLVTFEPSAHEVHTQVRQWFKDKEILDYVGRHLDEIADPSMRTYVLAQQLKAAKLDWKNALLLNWNKPIPVARVLAKLRTMTLPEREKERLFEKWTGMSRASYYNHKKRTPELVN